VAYSDSTKSPGISSNVVQQQETLSEEKTQALLNSFANESSSLVDIIFSFDTTGSMASCLGEVRKKVSETVSRLMKDIPNIRIGIIAHGDYCDDTEGGSMRTISRLDFIGAKGVNEIVNFVNVVHDTGGGDAPEAYELALREARTNFSWRKDASKALVVIGDEVPHPPSYTTEKINWFDETKKLADMGVKIYGIRALGNEYAIPFYEGISSRTGTVSIHFSNFKLIVDMFLAICYREASAEQLQKFTEEVKRDGKMTQELGDIFETLAKPNPERKEDRSDKLGQNYPWYNISLDNGSPQYTWSSMKKRWVAFSGEQKDSKPGILSRIRSVATRS
jgi:hypothetical protein